MQIKVFIVQKASGQVIAVKLKWEQARVIAKKHAPAKIWYGWADKVPETLNVSEHMTDQPPAG